MPYLLDTDVYEGNPSKIGLMRGRTRSLYGYRTDIVRDDAPYNMASLQLILGDRAGAAESLQQALRIPFPSPVASDGPRAIHGGERAVRLINAGRRTL